MAISKSFFGLRSGSTANHTYAIYNGKQVTKDRAASHPISDATRKQAEHFANAARFYPFVKNHISRSDFFRLVEGVRIETLSANGIPLARWPISWGLGLPVVVSKPLITPALGVFKGYVDFSQGYPESEFFDGLENVTRQQFSSFFYANRIRNWALFIIDLWFYNRDDLVKNAYRKIINVPLIFEGSGLNAHLKYPQYFVGAEEFSLKLRPFGPSQPVLNFELKSDQTFTPVQLDFRAYNIQPIAVGCIMCADGILSKSCLTI